MCFANSTDFFTLLQTRCGFDTGRKEKFLSFFFVVFFVFFITVFDLITAHAPKSTQPSKFVVFRLQSVYFYLQIMKTHLFKYIENFTSKKLKIFR